MAELNLAKLTKAELITHFTDLKDQLHNAVEDSMAKTRVIAQQDADTTELRQQVSHLTEEIRLMNSAGADIGKVFAYGITVPEGMEFFTGVIVEAEDIKKPGYLNIALRDTSGRTVYVFAWLCTESISKPEEAVGQEITHLVYSESILYPLVAANACDSLCPACNTTNCERYLAPIEEVCCGRNSDACTNCPNLPAEEVQELDPRYVTWKQLAKAYEHSAAMKWNILEMATYLRSLASSPEEFDGCPYAECVCAALYHVPRKNCLSKMPEKQELKWRKKIME